MDAQWWETYGAEVERTFAGSRYSNNATKWAKKLEKFAHYGNSGAGAVSLAIAGGASRVIMLGYDCQHTGGVKHWHGDHPPGMGNAGMVHKWAGKFKELSLAARGVDILNASRVTALDCFPRVELEDVLCQK